MRVINLIRQIPTQFGQALEQVIAKGTEIRIKIIHIWRTTFQEIQDASQKNLKFLYQRHIQPLNWIDYLVLGGSGLIAIMVTKIAVESFIALLPLALGTSTLIFLGGCSIVRSHVQKHFNHIAWEYLDQIRRVVYEMTHAKQNFDDIAEHRALLDNPLFEHLKNEIKQLDQEIQKFKEVALSDSYKDKQNILIDHLIILKPLVEADVEDKILIDNLEKNVYQISKEEDLKALEQFKQKLSRLRTLEAHSHLAELNEQIDALNKAVYDPKLINSKKLLIEYLERWQKELDSGKDIEHPSFEVDNSY